MSIGFTGVLTLIFITLKLTGYIDWSWWWVLAPTWITAIIGLMLIGVAVWAEAGKTELQRTIDRLDRMSKRS